MKELIVAVNDVKHNLEVVREKTAAKIIAVVKSDAYGLGLLQMTRLLYELGVRFFAVGEPREGVLLRENGFTDIDILLLRSTSAPDEINLMLDFNIIATIGSQDAAMALSGIAEARSTVASAHIKIDTGFGRYGFLPSETEKVTGIYRYMHSISVEGIYTQLDSHKSHKRALAQTAVFDEVLKTLHSQSLETGLVHAVSSTMLFRFRDLPHYDAVRIGAAIGGQIKGKTGLKHIGFISSSITDQRWIPQGAVVSGEKVHKSMKVGIVPVGYADGIGIRKPVFTKRELLAECYRRLFSTMPQARFSDGKRAKIIGRIGQNHLIVDISKNETSKKVIIVADALFCSKIIKRYE